jgi:predicted aldo/keto reductase-like oxidoreductase
MGMIRNNTELNKALDACAKAGIGMVAIKCMRGLGKAAKQPEKAREAFKNMGMSPHVAMLIGTLSDGRFASVCTEMPNRKIIEENCTAARAFRKPFDARQWKQLDEGMKLLSRATCSGCDGSCQRAAGTQTDFCSIARYLAYYEEDGKRDLARTLYNQLPPHRRDWQGADLKAASSACTSRLDFENILARAEKLLGERSA